MTRDELASKLASRIADGICWVSEAPIEVFEEASEGEAHVTCTFPRQSAGLFFRLDALAFPFLRQKGSLDWLVLLHHSDGSLDPHVAVAQIHHGRRHRPAALAGVGVGVLRAPRTGEHRTPSHRACVPRDLPRDRA